MAIGDLFRPKHKHSDIETRAEAIRQMTEDDRDSLVEIAKDDPEPDLRDLALGKLHDAELVADVAASATSGDARAAAERRAEELFVAVALGRNGDVDAAMLWLASHKADRSLARVACESDQERLRRRAIDSISQDRFLAEVVRKCSEPTVVQHALDRIDDGEVLRKLAMDTDDRDVGIGVVDRIGDDREVLAQLAARAKSKTVRGRANKRVLAMDKDESASIVIEEPDKAASPPPVPTASQPQSDPEPVTESVTEPVTEPVTESATVRVSAMEPESVTESATVTVTEPVSVTDAATVSVTELESASPPKPAKKGDAESNLAALEAMSSDVERLLAGEDLKLKTLEKKLTKIDNKFPKLVPLPSKGKRQAIERFQDVRRRLFIKIGELKEAEDWKRWANVPKQEELIRTVESLLENDDTSGLGGKLKELQEAWKNVGPAPREKGQELWERFKAGCDALYDRVKKQRRELNAQQKDNLAAKTALCERAEELSQSTDWGPTAEELKKLQTEWKAIGPVPRKQADALWKRFRAACDVFFERRRPHLEKTLDEQQSAIDRKTELCEAAEALSAGDDVDWDEAVRQLGRLRGDWKRAGRVPHKEHVRLSKRFDDAGDAVYKGRDEARQKAAAEKLGAIEEPLAEAETMLDAGGDIDGSSLAELTVRTRAALRDMQNDVDPPAELADRVALLCQRAVAAQPDAFKGSDLDPEQTRKRKEKLVQKVEKLVAKAREAQKPMAPEDMAAKLKAALADRALGGVLAKETVPIADKVADAKAAWAKLGPVPGTEGEELERRFDEACKQALSK